MTVEEFAAHFEAARRAETARLYPNIDLDGGRDDFHYRAKVIPGRVYTKVDFGGSGVYMVENATGRIYGIKAYGKVHKGHCYGTLDTVEDWDWGGYHAHRKGV